ncbi:hypothetical protein, partial [Streptomyces sp. SID3343]|uniref:hypothetical protein n=1 Tax=Streptomyces sp. SID3343 TaxID=2690260 RepID=UPI0013C22F90
MALQVEDLRKLFDGGGSAAPVELPGSAFDFRYDPFLAVVADGVLRLELAAGDGEADLDAAGTAVSALRAEPVPVRVTFHGRAGEVVAATLTAEPAEPAVPAHLPARGLGLDCAPLPPTAAVTRFVVRADAEHLLLTGSGPSLRLAVLCRGERLLVAEFRDDAGQTWRIVATDRELTREQVAAAATELAAEGAPVTPPRTPLATGCARPASSSARLRNPTRTPPTRSSSCRAR